MFAIIAFSSVNITFVDSFGQTKKYCPSAMVKNNANSMSAKILFLEDVSM